MSAAHAISMWDVRETVTPYRAGTPLEQAHRVAVSLAAARARLVLPLARVAAAVVRTSAHHEFGYPRLEDYCRERHGRGSRWLRDLAALQGRFEKLPALAAAVAGDDGKPPLHVSAAMAIGTVATPESVDGWIARGREVTLARLKNDIRAESGTAAPETEPEWVRVQLSVPCAVRAAFDETLDLHRAVVGAESSVTSFVESLIAESMTELGLPEPAVEKQDPEADLPRSGETSRALKLAGESLERLERLMEVAGTGDARQLDRHLGELLRLQNTLELRLGEVLRKMGEMKGWRHLGFEDAGHYAERALSMSRTVAEDRVWVAAAVRRFALVKQAYEKGELSWEATRSVLRLLKGSDPHDLKAQRLWIAHGRASTVKRLRDEARARLRASGMGEPPRPARPMSDEAWHASLRREPGTATERMARFGQELIRRAESGTLDEKPMRLRLPVDLAQDFMYMVQARLTRESEPSTASGQLTRIFSTRGCPPPLWVGLLELLEDCVRLWDPDPRQASVGGPDRRELFARSGYRCVAPGCTARANLQGHHLVFRSEGGGEELTNKDTLCLFHHLRGIHGGLATARGKAPLGITWRLGRDGVGGQFRNEIKEG